MKQPIDLIPGFYCKLLFSYSYITAEPRCQEVLGTHADRLKDKEREREREGGRERGRVQERYCKRAKNKGEAIKMEKNDIEH